MKDLAEELDKRLPREITNIILSYLDGKPEVEQIKKIGGFTGGLFVYKRHNLRGDGGKVICGACLGCYDAEDIRGGIPLFYKGPNEIIRVLYSARCRKC